MLLKSRLLRFLQDKLFLVIFIFVFLKWLLITLILKGNIPFGGDQVPPFNIKFYVNYINLALFWNLFGVFYFTNIIYTITRFLVSSIINGPSFTLTTLYLFMSLVQSILFYYVFIQIRSLFNLTNKQIFCYAMLFFLLYSFFFYFALNTFKSYLSTILGWKFVALLVFLIIILKLALKKKLNFYDYLIFILIFLILLDSIAAFIRYTILFLFMVILSLIVLYKKRDFIKLMKYGGVLLILMLILSIPYVFQFSIIEKALKERVHWKEVTLLSKYPEHSKILDVIRLTSTWVARSKYCPYCSKLLSLSTLLIYPLSVFSLLFLIRKEDNTKKCTILYCMLLLLIFYFFSTLTNPPLGFLYNLLNKVFVKTIGVSIMSIFPSGIINQFIASLYLILSPLTLILMINYLPRKFSIALLTTFLITHFINAFPILSGKVFCQWYDQSICGFSVPEDYKEIDNIFLELAFYEHVLLLPITPTYIKTSWGFQGTILAIKQLIHPSTIIYSFAPYVEYYAGRIIGKLDSPFSSKGLTTNLNIKSKEDFCHRNDEKIKYIDIVYKLQTTYNLNNYKLIEVEIRPKIQDKIWVGIGDEKGFIGWYFGYKYCYDMKSMLVCYLPIKWNDKPSISSTYDRRNVRLIILRIFNKSYCNVDINIKSKVYKEIRLNKKLLQLFNVRYIIFDSSIEINKDKKENLLEYLKSSTRLIRKTEFLYIFEGVNKTSPVWIVINDKIEKPSLEKVAPTHIKGFYYIRDVTKFYLVIPLMYYPTVEKILDVKLEGGRIRKITNYLGLLAYEVLPEKRYIIFEIGIKDFAKFLYYSTLYTPFMALAFLFLLRRFRII